MCRLYAFRANEPTKVECSLVIAQNALLRQSRSDLRGVAHPDGWGIGCYIDSVPRVERGESAAFADVRFSVTAERLYTRTVLAHVRLATVGGSSVLNTHPFVFGRWSFAHNGTVRGFERVAAEMEADIAPELLAERRGTTDSELTFYWLLTRLRAAGVDLDNRGPDLAQILDQLADSLCALDGICRSSGAQEPAKLNFVLTDGELLVASRWRNSLHLLCRDGVRDCQICGIPHVQHEPSIAYRATIVASEPISAEPWQEIPDPGLVGIDADLRTEVREL
jgi:glutamine amidotransferase